jgi:hypothetical protein
VVDGEWVKLLYVPFWEEVRSRWWVTSRSATVVDNRQGALDTWVGEGRAMTIEIQQPDFEALIEQRMASGAFPDVETALFQALKSAPLPQAIPKSDEARNLVEVCAMVKGLADDLDFSRNPSTGRPVDLS